MKTLAEIRAYLQQNPNADIVVLDLDDTILGTDIHQKKFIINKEKLAELLQGKIICFATDKGDVIPQEIIDFVNENNLWHAPELFMNSTIKGRLWMDPQNDMAQKPFLTLISSSKELNEEAWFIAIERAFSIFFGTSMKAATDATTLVNRPTNSSFIRTVLKALFADTVRLLRHQQQSEETVQQFIQIYIAYCKQYGFESDLEQIIVMPQSSAGISHSVSSSTSETVSEEIKHSAALSMAAIESRQEQTYLDTRATITDLIENQDGTWQCTLQYEKTDGSAFLSYTRKFSSILDIKSFIDSGKCMHFLWFYFQLGIMPPHNKDTSDGIYLQQRADIIEHSGKKQFFDDKGNFCAQGRMMEFESTQADTAASFGQIRRYLNTLLDEIDPDSPNKKKYKLPPEPDPKDLATLLRDVTNQWPDTRHHELLPLRLAVEQLDLAAIGRESRILIAITELHPGNTYLEQLGSAPIAPLPRAAAIDTAMETSASSSSNIYNPYAEKQVDAQSNYPALRALIRKAIGNMGEFKDSEKITNLLAAEKLDIYKLAQTVNGLIETYSNKTAIRTSSKTKKANIISGLKGLLTHLRSYVDLPPQMLSHQESVPSSTDYNYIMTTYQRILSIKQQLKSLAIIDDTIKNTLDVLFPSEDTHMSISSFVNPEKLVANLNELLIKLNPEEPGSQKIVSSLLTAKTRFYQLEQLERALTTQLAHGLPLNTHDMPRASQLTIVAAIFAFNAALQMHMRTAAIKIPNLSETTPLQLSLALQEPTVKQKFADIVGILQQQLDPDINFKEMYTHIIHERLTHIVTGKPLHVFYDDIDARQNMSNDPVLAKALAYSIMTHSLYPAMPTASSSQLSTSALPPLSSSSQPSTSTPPPPSSSSQPTRFGGWRTGRVSTHTLTEGHASLFSHSAATPPTQGKPHDETPTPTADETSSSAKTPSSRK